MQPRELTEEQASVLSFGPRAALFSLIASVGPLPVSEMANQLDRSAKGLYRHVAILQKVGLVTEAGRQPSERRPEALYAASSDYVLTPRSVTPASSQSRARLAANVARTAARAFGKAACELPEADERRRALSVLVMTLRLSNEDANTLAAKFEEALAWAKDHERRSASGKFTAAIILAPMLPRKHQAGPRKRRGS